MSHNIGTSLCTIVMSVQNSYYFVHPQVSKQKTKHSCHKKFIAAPKKNNGPDCLLPTTMGPIASQKKRACIQKVLSILGIIVTRFLDTGNHNVFQLYVSNRHLLWLSYQLRNHTGMLFNTLHTESDSIALFQLFSDLQSIT